MSRFADVEQVVKDVVSTMGQNPDILVNCAGINSGGSLLDVQEDAFDNVISINLKVMSLIIDTIMHIRYDRCLY